jgi:hypothetical protein
MLLHSEEPDIMPAIAVEQDFQTVWTEMCARFHAGQHITTESLSTGVPRSTFTIVRIEPESVVIACPDTRSERSIHRDAFAQGFLIWPKYCEGAISEDILRDSGMPLSFVFAIFKML